MAARGAAPVWRVCDGPWICRSSLTSTAHRWPRISRLAAGLWLDRQGVPLPGRKSERTQHKRASWNELDAWLQLQRTQTAADGERTRDFAAPSGPATLHLDQGR